MNFSSVLALIFSIASALATATAFVIQHKLLQSGVKNSVFENRVFLYYYGSLCIFHLMFATLYIVSAVYNVNRISFWEYCEKFSILLSLISITANLSCNCGLMVVLVLWKTVSDFSWLWCLQPIFLFISSTKIMTRSFYMLNFIGFAYVGVISGIFYANPGRKQVYLSWTQTITWTLISLISFPASFDMMVTCWKLAKSRDPKTRLLFKTTLSYCAAVSFIALYIFICLLGSFFKGLESPYISYYADEKTMKEHPIYQKLAPDDVDVFYLISGLAGLLTSFPILSSKIRQKRMKNRITKPSTSMFLSTETTNK